MRITFLMIVAAAGLHTAPATSSELPPITANADHQISAQLRDLLYKNPSLASNDISVQTHDGVVYLYGLVDTNVQRADVEATAKAIAGVKRVVDSIELRNDVR